MKAKSFLLQLLTMSAQCPLLLAFICLHFIGSLSEGRVPLRLPVTSSKFEASPSRFASTLSESSGNVSKSVSVANYAISTEILRPISTPSSQKVCRVTLMDNHPFGNNPPPYTSQYKPPTKCGKTWSLIVLNVNVNAYSVQYDRRLVVALGGLEILRSTTQAPRGDGDKWRIDKDITKYFSYLSKPRLFTSILENYFSGSNNGTFYVTASLAFFSGKPASGLPHLTVPVNPEPKKPASFEPYLLSYTKPSASITLSNLPTNPYHAELEIALSHHAKDEFYWGNAVTSYVNALPSIYQGGFTSGGVFRELLVFIDNKPAGSVWPKPLIYTGGVLFLFWFPVVGIGAFVTPTYSIDLDPFLPILADGKNHSVRISVQGVVQGGEWFVSGRLNFWLDPKLKKTFGKMTENKVKSQLSPREIVKFRPNGLDAIMSTFANRVDVTSGFVISSFGNITTTVRRVHNLTNTNEFLNQMFSSSVRHLITSEYTIIKKNEKGKVIYTSVEKYAFPLNSAMDYVIFNDNDFSVSGNYSHAFNFDKKISYGNYKNVHTFQNNEQNGTGYYTSSNNEGQPDGTNSCDQTLVYKNINYKYDNKKKINSISNQDCYYRSIKVNRFRLVEDDSFSECNYIK